MGVPLPKNLRAAGNKGAALLMDPRPGGDRKPGTSGPGVVVPVGSTHGIGVPGVGVCAGIGVPETVLALNRTSSIDGPS